MACCYRVEETHISLTTCLLFRHIFELIQVCDSFHWLDPTRCRFCHLNNIRQVHALWLVLNALKTANFFLDWAFRLSDIVELLLNEYLILQRQQVGPLRRHLVVNWIVLSWVPHRIRFVELFVQWFGSYLRVVGIGHALFLIRILGGICIALPDCWIVDVEFVRDALVGRHLLITMNTVPLPLLSQIPLILKLWSNLRVLVILRSVASKFVCTHMLVFVQVIFCLICAAGEERLSALHHVVLGCISTHLLLELRYSCLIIFFISICVSALRNI